MKIRSNSLSPTLLLSLPLFALCSLSMLAGPPKVEIIDSGNQIDVSIGGKPFTSYLHTPDPNRRLPPGLLQTKPALHPVHGPSGTVMTRAYPFADVEGEDKDHPHHMGLFFTVDEVNPGDNKFWGNSKNPLPAIRHVRVEEMKGGEGKGRLKTISHWIGKDEKALLEEERDMVFLALDDNSWAIDLTIGLKAIDQEITIEDTKEGMLAFRVAQWLTEKNTGRYLNSEGEETESGVWGKRARWIRLQGEHEGRKTGIAFLAHPQTTNNPPYWHARGYGCFSANPLGQKDFQTAHKISDPQPYNLRIAPGEKALFKYRLVLYDGEWDRARTEEQYQAYTRQ
jgi:hypothetical protein